MKNKILFLILPLVLTACSTRCTPTKKETIDVEGVKITVLNAAAPSDKSNEASIESKVFDWVSIHYVGQLTDKTIFDDSYLRNEPLKFQLGAGHVIKGLDIGVTGMKVGEKRKIEIPFSLAYGESGSGGIIPANADLIFEVELLQISKE